LMERRSPDSYAQPNEHASAAPYPDETVERAQGSHTENDTNLPEVR
jgi:hypothetical protein